MGRTIANVLENDYTIRATRSEAAIILNAALTSISFTAGNEQKLNFTSATKEITSNGGWSYNNSLTRFTWLLDLNFVPIFWGAASVKMTTGTTPILTFKLKVNGSNDIITTPMNYSTTDKIQQLAANGPVKNGIPYISQNDYFEFWAISDQNATYDLLAFQITLLGR